MKKVLVAGKTVEDAVKTGLEQLGTTEDRVSIEVVEQPNKGLFGLLGAREAKVELELLPMPKESTRDFLAQVLLAMGLDVAIEEKETKDGTLFHINGNDLGILIGRRGQTLDALQYLTNIVANKSSDEFMRVVLDAENFRERRKQTLTKLSERLADKVIRTKRDVILEPMSPQDRKIIHSELQEHPTVRTYSKGNEPNRRVVITLK